MLITFKCPECEAELEADASSAGSRVTCPSCNTDINVPSAGLGPGTTVGGYQIESKLGAGGMGEVYLATQLSMERRVALKVLPPNMSVNKDMSDRFLSELKILARLEHPNIVAAFDAGKDSGVLYFAMAYVAGESAAEHIENKGPFTEKDALSIGRKLAGALAYAWNEHTMLHRDIKPSNILVDKKGEPRLVDFGLAKTLNTDQCLTMTNVMIGTPNYMSPEQVEGSALDVRADMYSMGATLYHMLTGNIPFGGSSVVEIIRKQLSDPLPDPRAFNPELSEGAVEFLEILLAKDRNARHESWEAVISDIDTVLAGGRPSRETPGKSTLIRARDMAELEAIRKGTPHKRPVKKPMPKIARKTARPAPVIKPKANHTPAYIAAAGIAALIIIGAGIMIMRPKPGAEPEPPEIKDISTTEDVSAVKDATRAAYMDAVEYGNLNPDDTDGIINRLESVIEKAPESEYARRAGSQIRAIKERIEQAEASAWAALEQRVRSLAGQGDYNDALALLSESAGQAGASIEARREALSGEITRLRDKHASAEPAEEERAETVKAAHPEKPAPAVKPDKPDLDTDELLGKIASLAVAMRFDEARQALEPGLESAAPGITALLDGLCGIDEAIIESFRSDRGSTVTVGTDKGPVEIRIKNVEGSHIVADRRLQAGTIEVRVPLDSLTDAERVKRIAALPEDVRAVYTGALAMRLGREDYAENVFAKAGPLSRPLVGRFADARARTELQSILHRAGLQTTDPEAIKKELMGKEFPEDHETALNRLVANYRRRFADSSYARENDAALDAMLSTIAETRARIPDWEKPWVVEGVGMELVPIPPDTGNLSRPFWMGKYEVTQGQYERLYGTPHSHGSVENMPLNNITWNDAVEFCRKLTELEKHRIPIGYEFRLPTNDEWIYCCFADARTAFSFGDDWTQVTNYAWFASNSGDRAHPVGAKKPNQWGLYDMYGNVDELLFEFYATDDISIRHIGGSYTTRSSPAQFRRGEARQRKWVTTAYRPSVGFRVCLAPVIERSGEE